MILACRAAFWKALGGVLGGLLARLGAILGAVACFFGDSRPRWAIVGVLGGLLAPLGGPQDPCHRHGGLEFALRAPRPGPRVYVYMCMHTIARASRALKF